MMRAYDGYVFDLDGTLYLGDRLIEGAQDTVSRLRARGARVVFLSNKPLEPGAVYARKLDHLGIPAGPDDVINSTQALLSYLREHHADSSLFVVGEHALVQEVAQAGFALSDDADEIDIVVAAFDRTLDYAKLNIAYQALKRGARFFATNADKTCPIEGGDIPDCAGVIAFLEATTGRQVELVAGKPSRHILDAAVSRLGVPASNCLVVGDRLATDMAMGQRAGIDTALVLTGVTSRSDLLHSQLQPTYVLESVAAIR